MSDPNDVIPEGWRRHRPTFYEGPKASAFVRGGLFVIDSDAPDIDGSYGVPVSIARAVLGADGMAQSIREVRLAAQRAQEAMAEDAPSDVLRSLLAQIEASMDGVPA